MAKTSTSSVESQEQLVGEMKSAISDAEDVLTATAGQVGAEAAHLRARIQERLKAAKLLLVEAEEVLVAKTNAAARAADEYVRDSPWTAIGIAGTAGLLVGLIIARR